MLETPWLSFDGVNTGINRHLDLVTAIFTRPEMTDFVFHFDRQLWMNGALPQNR
jgi:hypothetical protein